MNLNTPVDKIKGIGEKRKIKLEALGIYTLEDLVFHFPRDYEDRRNVLKISSLLPEEINTFKGRVISLPETIRIKGKTITKAEISDETGKVLAIWYNQGYLKDTLKPERDFLFTGKLQKKYGKKEVISPEIEPITEGEAKGGIRPVYPLTKGVNQKLLRDLIKYALKQTEGEFSESLPFCVRKEYELCEKNFAMHNIHFPSDFESFFIARRRLVFEELFILQTALFRLKALSEEKSFGRVMKKTKEYDKFINSLGFELTEGQKAVIKEIASDMSSGGVMNRLIQGNVGSGKTAVAAASAFIAISSGAQAALMAPTEVLANQHYKSFCRMFSKFNIPVYLLTGGMDKKSRKDTLDKISDGSAKMVIGTHAIIRDAVKFKDLGLIITDEQHRFGVKQRISLSEKGAEPHVLVMTATPIPRTLALVLYGDMDISIINTMPQNRKSVKTFYVNSAYRSRVFEFIKKEIAEGGKAYIICPSVTEGIKDGKAAISYAEDISKNEFKDFNVACLYGRLKPKEKEEIMQGFALGKTDVLVATTVIEVGIDVPGASVILIENAESFGLSQLYQLRGRVGRGSRQSYCIMISDLKSSLTKKRMEIMKKTDDGFLISEMDLKLRGPGDFFGIAQHGLPELKIADLYKDKDILKEAQKAAKAVISYDKYLEKEENMLLKNEINKKFFTNKISL